MPFPSQDVYWVEAADFIRKHGGPEVRMVAPNDFMGEFAHSYPYDLLNRLNPETVQFFVVHKGALKEMDFPRLDTLARTWFPVFANAVFVILAPPATKLKTAHSLHVDALTEQLEILRSQRLGLSEAPGRTVILVTTYNRPDALRRSLNSLLALNVPLLVVNDGSSPEWAEAYTQIQREFPIQVLTLPENRGLPSALNCGLSYWLADPAVEWISYFQDDVEVRPDALDVLARYQHPVRQPLLSGRFDPLHTVVREETREGVKLIHQRSCPGIHLHAHRRYWEGVMPIPTPYLGAPKKNSPRPGRGADEDWWITSWSPASAAKNGGTVCVVPGLVRTFVSEAKDSTWGGAAVLEPELTSPASISGKNPPHWWPALAQRFGQHNETFVHPHTPPERGELYHSLDDGSTELETLQFLAALVCLFKPRVVLETGAYRGFGSLTLASGLETNGFGQLISLEPKADAVAEARRTVGAWDPRLLNRIRFVEQDSLGFLEQYDGPAFDFCFLDSLLELRVEEFFTLQRRGLLAPGAVIVLHDTSLNRQPNQPGGGPEAFVGREKLDALGPEFEGFEFPYSRGFRFFRYRG